MKVIGNAKYVHRMDYKALRLPRFVIDAFIGTVHRVGLYDYDILKLVHKKGKIVLSAIWTDGFGVDTNYEPSITQSARMVYKNGAVDIKVYMGRGQIYHRKDLFITPESAKAIGMNYELAQARSKWIDEVVKETEGYDAYRIGYKEFWENLIEGLDWNGWLQVHNEELWEEVMLIDVDVEEELGGKLHDDAEPCSVDGCENKCHYVQESKRRKQCCKHSSSKKETCNGCETTPQE